MLRHKRDLVGIRVPLGATSVLWDASWLVVTAAGLWITATIYVATLGAFLNRPQTWAATALIALLVGLSLFAHAAGHAVAAAWLHAKTPPKIPLYLLGDAAQVWPAASSPWREALVALAGPFVNVLLAGLAYLTWNAQLNPYLNVSMPLVGVLNLALMVVNLAPAFPFDGGRLTRALGWGLLGRPAAMMRVAITLGFVFAAALAGWGLFLFAENSRFSLATGLAAEAWAALILLELGLRRAWRWDRPADTLAGKARFVFGRALLVGLLMVCLLVVSAGLAPLNNGLEAPGVALDTAPMVEVPPAHRHPSAGAFILTTVIQQTPIVLAEWAAAQAAPTVIKLMPPQQIVPPNTTIQKQYRAGYQMLDESEMTAVVVGLRLAGYQALAAGRGARIDSILPDSPSRTLLQPGDVIVSLDGHPIQTTADLTTQLATKHANSTVHLQVRRGNQKLDVAAPLMPPATPDGAPRLGITITSAGFDYTLPFPVRIVPQKIVGGPSAGLMFTLTVYDLVTPGDLTGGRRIAGTGTISLDGTVGPIGGVKEKVVAAELAGARYFLSPPENYAAARRAARSIKVVEVSTAAQAIAFLQGLNPPATPYGHAPTAR
jgi:PDZ domain-containing protein